VTEGRAPDIAYTAEEAFELEELERHARGLEATAEHRRRQGPLAPLTPGPGTTIVEDPETGRGQGPNYPARWECRRCASRDFRTDPGWPGLLVCAECGSVDMYALDPGDTLAVEQALRNLGRAPIKPG
jgi:hypothetical protein